MAEVSVRVRKRGRNKGSRAKKVHRFVGKVGTFLEKVRLFLRRLESELSLRLDFLFWATAYFVLSADKRTRFRVRCPAPTGIKKKTPLSTIVKRGVVEKLCA